MNKRVDAAAMNLSRALNGLKAGDRLLFSNTPEGFDAFVAADLARALSAGDREEAAVFVHVARDVSRSAQFCEALRFAAPWHHAELQVVH